MAIHLGVGSLPDKTFRGFDYASNMMNVYDDKNYTHYGVAHPQLNGTFWYDKWAQPNYNTHDPICLASIMMGTLGKITPEVMYRDDAG